MMANLRSGYVTVQNGCKKEELRRWLHHAGTGGVAKQAILVMRERDEPLSGECRGNRSVKP